MAGLLLMAFLMLAVSSEANSAVSSISCFRCPDFRVCERLVHAKGHGD